jgi:hypothetical protein
MELPFVLCHGLTRVPYQPFPFGQRAPLASTLTVTLQVTEKKRSSSSGLLPRAVGNFRSVYRTRKDVFLGFGVIQSGKVYGTVDYCSIVQGYQDPHYVLPLEDYRVVEQLPKSISQPKEGEPYGTAQVSSAPATHHNPHHRLLVLSLHKTRVPVFRVKSLPFELHADGLYRALRDQSVSPATHPTIP